MEIGPEFDRLTDKQKAYALGRGSGTMTRVDAYRAAYPNQNMTNAQMSSECGRLDNHPLISRLIMQIESEAAKTVKVSREWMINWHLMRSTYDASEFVKIEFGACRYCHGEGHAYQWQFPIYLEELNKATARKLPAPDIGGGFGYNKFAAPHPDCPSCNGGGLERARPAEFHELSEKARAAYEGVELTKDGFKIKMADKTAAAAALAKLLGWDVAKAVALVDMPDPEVIAKMSPEDAVAVYRRHMEAR